uniref:Uncharacterized protein n=1 Tax=Romanomermis culicivorax TaxID=13658 RepID=A0A915KR39_ROMCU
MHFHTILLYSTFFATKALHVNDIEYKGIHCELPCKHILDCYHQNKDFIMDCDKNVNCCEVYGRRAVVG